jgi:argininosuccinate synthase
LDPPPLDNFATSAPRGGVLARSQPVAHLAEGKVLEDPWADPEEFVLSYAIPPRPHPKCRNTSIFAFQRGDPVALDGEILSPAAPLTRLNEIGGSHDIGRLDLVKNRFVGMEPRGVSETPGG